MTIETKYGVGDKVWFLDGWGKIQHIEINGVDVSIRKNQADYVKYFYNPGNGTTHIAEDKLRKTKAEVGDDWLKLNGLDKKKK